MKKTTLLSSAIFIFFTTFIYSNDGGPLYVNITTVTNASCYGISNGSIFVTAGNGTGPYTYVWSPSGGTSALASNLAPGTYTVTVTDAVFATATATAVVGESFPITITTDSTSDYFGYNISCFEGNNGWINTTVTGGLMMGLDSVTYHYTDTEQIYIVPPGVTQITIKTWGAQGGANWVNNVNYGGYTSGDLNVIPGETLYVYVGNQPTGITGGFNGGGNGEGAGKGGGGASDVRQGGNTLNDRKIVAGGAGAAGYWSNLHVVGGIGGGLIGGDGHREPDYASNPGGQGGTQSSSGTGTCISLYNSAMAGGFGYGGAPVSCGCEGYGGGGGWYGGAGSGNCRGAGGGSSYIGGVTNSIVLAGVNIGDGKVTIIYSGIEALSYQWLQGPTTDDVAGLTAGTYTLTVNSVSGCADTVAYTITEPTDIAVSFHSTDISCLGDNNGSITANTSGGIAPYTYLWNNSATTSSISNLSQGVYVLAIMDSAGCIHTDSTSITEPTALSLSATTVIESLGNDGSIDLFVTGGTSPYTYLWSNSSINQDLTGLAGGSYTVEVTDTNGCVDSLTVLVGSTFSIENDAFNALSVYPNPTEGIFYIQVPVSFSGEFSVSVMDIHGRAIYTSAGIANGQVISVNAERWSAGNYMVVFNTGTTSFTKRIVVH